MMQIKQAILTGQLKAGDRLPAERDLAGEFQVSRTSVREAIRKLEINGFVSIQPGVTGGAYVTDLNFESLSGAFLDLYLAGKITIPELCEVHTLVMPEVARKAALTISASGKQRLKEAYEQGLKLASLSFHDILEKKTIIPFILAEQCGNKFLEALVKSIQYIILRFVMTVMPEHSRDLHLHEEILPMVEAVLGGDAEGAFAAARTGALRFGEMLLQLDENPQEKRSLAGANH
jgi:GntR family transcriptional regulator, transcriptional repressor for pyruvate dehydrogenase complex